MTGPSGSRDDASLEVAATRTVGAVLTDLIDIAERLPVQPDQAEHVARILDRLSEEITEASALIRGTAAPAAAFPAWRADGSVSGGGAAPPAPPPDIADDERVTRARTLLAEHHQPLTMTPGDVRALLARFQRSTVELLAVIDGQPAGRSTR